MAKQTKPIRAYPDGYCLLGEFLLEGSPVSRTDFACLWGEFYPDCWDLVREMIQTIGGTFDGFLRDWLWHDIGATLRGASNVVAEASVDVPERDSADVQREYANRKRDCFRTKLKNYHDLIGMIEAARERRDTGLVALLETYRLHGMFDPSRLKELPPFFWMTHDWTGG